MRVKLHQKTSGDQFEVVGSFELEATSDGIDILNKIVKPKVSMPGDKTRSLERSPLEGDIAMACFLSGYAMQRERRQKAKKGIGEI